MKKQSLIAEITRLNVRIFNDHQSDVQFYVFFCFPWKKLRAEWFGENEPS